jgi:hypothetical protein
MVYRENIGQLKHLPFYMISATTDTSKRNLLRRQSNWNLALQMLSLRMRMLKRNNTNLHQWQNQIQRGDCWHKPVPA